MKPEIVAATERAFEFTRRICRKHTSRLTGTTACLDTADEIKSELAQFCNSVHQQDFTTHPDSFLGFIRVSVALYFVALWLYWLNWYGTALLVGLVNMVIVAGQFFLYRELLDGFYPRRQSRNVWGVIEPTGRARQQIVVSAHHDSAHVFTFLEHCPAQYILLVNAGFAISIGLWLASGGTWLAQAFGYDTSATAAAAKWTFAILSVGVLPLWFFYKRQGTPGAGDDLICVASGLEIGRYFAQPQNRLQHTRLIVASWDAEECGLRGARAFIGEHQSLLSALPTSNLNFECFYQLPHLSALTSDLNGFVKLSETLAAECTAIGSELGYDIRSVRFPLLAGGTDAAEFSKAGIAATTLQGMCYADKGNWPAYHTTRDTIENVSWPVTSAVIDISLSLIQRKDRRVG
ncbi:MAG: M28 family peptidase [Pirellulaceae bacterium]|nr:M28 family peptidase [Pirellulaceae bacterium]